MESKTGLSDTHPDIQRLQIELAEKAYGPLVLTEDENAD
jgi:hypothetical protein